MSKPLRNLIIALLICLGLGASAWFLLTSPPTAKNASESFLVQKKSTEIAMIEVKNQNGAYKVWQKNGEFFVHDIPKEVVNTEYLEMLLDECSNVQYISVASKNTKELSDFGLDNPTSTVDISYSDGASLNLLIGNEETVSEGRYMMKKGGDSILLMKNSRTIRFTMPVQKYINYIIIEPNVSTSILSAVQDITFSGSQLQKPIALKAVLEDREDIKRQAASFGAVTHLMISPALHEADQTELISLTDSLLGLISEKVIDYNCTSEELYKYGFDKPLLKVEFDYKNGKDAVVKHIVLKMSKLDGKNIVTLDGQGIVYQIADVAFTKVSYEKLVNRWFLSPFITDVKCVEVAFEDMIFDFDLSGDTAKNLSVKLGEKEIKPELFRKYYNLLLSAAAEDSKPESCKPTGEKQMSVRFIYKDTQKADDIMEFSKGNLRRVYAKVNAVCEFDMRDKYIECVKAATEALNNGEIFSVEW